MSESAAAETIIDNDNAGQEDSLRDIIEKTYDAAAATGDEQNANNDGERASLSGGEEGDAAAATAEQQSQDEGAAADKDTSAGAEAAANVDLTSDIENEDKDADKDAAGKEEKVAYPEHWDQKLKDEFEALPPASQQFMMNRINEMQADHTRKTQEAAEIRKQYEPIDQIMAPFQPVLQQNGWAPAELIRRWAVAESHLNANPHQAIKALASHYGVDLTDLAYGGQYYDENPQPEAGQQPSSIAQDPAFQQVQATLTTLQANEQKKALDEFADAVDESGNKLHPYFDDVINDIMLELQLDRSQGRQSELPDLYERACWRNTSIREKMLAAQQSATDEATRKAAEEAAAKATQEASSKAEQARKAGKSIDGDPGAGGTAAAKPVQHKSVRSAVEAAFAQHS